MEYIYYLLVVLGLLLACLYAFRAPGILRLKGDKSELHERARRRRVRAGAPAEYAGNGNRLKHHQQVLERSLASVPTPWGWPGHDEARHSSDHSRVESVSESFHQWVDLLVREKQTIDDQAYQSRTSESLKALLEDRYAPPGKGASAIDYRKIKASLLRDPSNPHDQMGNFPSGRTGQIVDGLERQPGKRELVRSLTDGTRRKTSLKEVRTPWGW